jgi:hypothetical protein
MLDSSSAAKDSIADRAERIAQKKSTHKRSLRPVHGFVIASCFLIAVMWSVTIFFRVNPPERTAGFAENEEMFLVVVDDALKRYANYEQNGYPLRLIDLVPKYLPLKESELKLLRRVSYELDPQRGYNLHLVNSQGSQQKAVYSVEGLALQGGVK